MADEKKDGVTTVDVSTPAGQIKQCAEAQKSVLAAVGSLVVGADLGPSVADLKAQSLALDETLSSRPLIREFLDRRGLAKYGDLDEQGKEDLRKHLEGLWEKHVKPLLDEPHN